MTTNAADIIEGLQTQLSGSEDLDYVKQFLLGIREGIATYPVIIIEPNRLVESTEVYGQQDLHVELEVKGILDCKDKEKQIVGDANTKGIMDFENDVKLALDSDRQIGGIAIDSKIIETNYDYSAYPLRAFSIKIDAWFRQTESIR